MSPYCISQATPQALRNSSIIIQLSMVVSNFNTSLLRRTFSGTGKNSGLRKKGTSILREGGMRRSLGEGNYCTTCDVKQNHKTCSLMTRVHRMHFLGQGLCLDLGFQLKRVV